MSRRDRQFKCHGCGKTRSGFKMMPVFLVGAGFIGHYSYTAGTGVKAGCTDCFEWVQGENGDGYSRRKAATAQGGE